MREQKLKNLEKGLYDDLYVNIELPTSLEEKKFSAIEDYLEYIVGIKPSLDGTPERQTVKVSKAKELLMNFYHNRLPYRVPIIFCFFKQKIIDWSQKKLNHEDWRRRDSFHRRNWQNRLQQRTQIFF